MEKRLIIWDFDGVISDTEHLWVKIWQDLMNERFNAGWDFKKANEIVGGIALKTKIERLKKLGIEIDDDFLKEVMRREIEIMNGGMKLIDGVENVFRLKEFNHCIATGGYIWKTKTKIDSLGIGKYFPDAHVFSAEQVEHGKPEPDLFLFAAEKMGYEPKDCVVIEDSLAGLTAGLKAGMTTIAFVGAEMNDNPEYIQKIENLGIKHIFDKMDEIKRFLLILSR